MGSKKLIITDKSNPKIAVEIKNFINAFLINDLEKALG
ncbi:MAG: hypothetical protein J7F05_12855 [Trichodesmium erythraeum GBRTRLIN201]|nr:hypothetical protein [Trichodesmium erythraeum GBRTRLIN201]